MERTPLRVYGRSGRTTLNVNASPSKSQWTPKERCVGTLSCWRSKSRMLFPQFSSGSASITETESETALCSLSWAVAKMACVYCLLVCRTGRQSVVDVEIVVNKLFGLEPGQVFSGGTPRSVASTRLDHGCQRMQCSLR